jgi:hypothetical protein
MAMIAQLQVQLLQQLAAAPATTSPGPGQPTPALLPAPGTTRGVPPAIQVTTPGGRGNLLAPRPVVPLVTALSTAAPGCPLVATAPVPPLVLGFGNWFWRPACIKR